MKRIFLSLALVAGLSQTLPAQIKVACMGDSVTYGMTIEDRENCSYPAQLQKMLGDGYEVRNFGHNGATLLYHGHRPYIRMPECAAALEYAPDVAVIHLGLNDTDPRDWPDWSDEFVGDYRSLIDTLRSVNPEMKIWICRLTPVMNGHRRFLSGTRDWHAQVRAEIERVARTADVGYIDLYEPLCDRTDLFRDSLHPDAEGAGIIAGTVYSALTGDFGGLQLGILYTDGMVLQRDREIVLRGTADAGATVTAELRLPTVQKSRRKAVMGEVVASGEAEVGEAGRWAVKLPGMPAGGPYELEISDGRTSRTMKDVWLGEVWVCTGQSNMDFQLRQCTTAEEDIASAGEQEKLRLFDMRENWYTGNVEWPRSALDSVNRYQYFTPSGWQKCSAESARVFSAIGYHFGRVLADSLGCHVGLICNSVGGATTESFVDYETLTWEFPEILADWNHGDFGQEWARGRALKNIALSDNPLQRHPYQPAYLFSAAMKPLDRYGIKGIVWYQGESNAHNIEAHERLFGLMVWSWRQYWGEDIPVEMIQLSGIGTRPSWPKFRDSQRRLSETVPGVFMTVCSDLGNPTDVHPKAKKPVGERAASSVLHNLYGYREVTPCGPVYRTFNREGNALRLHFDFADGLTASKGFEIAGEDGIYYPASVRVEGHTVVVSSPSVEAPCAVRYGWQANPVDADLVNSAGYPCSTFKDEPR